MSSKNRKDRYGDIYDGCNYGEQYDDYVEDAESYERHNRKARRRQEREQRRPYFRREDDSEDWEEEDETGLAEDLAGMSDEDRKAMKELLREQAELDKKKSVPQSLASPVNPGKAEKKESTESSKKPARPKIPGKPLAARLAEVGKSLGRGANLFGRGFFKVVGRMRWLASKTYGLLKGLKKLRRSKTKTDTSSKNADTKADSAVTSTEKPAPQQRSLHVRLLPKFQDWTPRKKSLVAGISVLAVLFLGIGIAIFMRPSPTLVAEKPEEKTEATAPAVPQEPQKETSAAAPAAPESPAVPESPAAPAVDAALPALDPAPSADTPADTPADTSSEPAADLGWTPTPESSENEDVEIPIASETPKTISDSEIPPLAEDFSMPALETPVPSTTPSVPEAPTTPEAPATPEAPVAPPASLETPAPQPEETPEETPDDLLSLDALPPANTTEKENSMADSLAVAPGVNTDHILAPGDFENQRPEDFSPVADPYLPAETLPVEEKTEKTEKVGEKQEAAPDTTLAALPEAKPEEDNSLDNLSKLEPQDTTPEAPSTENLASEAKQGQNGKISNDSVYVVQPGDNYWDISEKIYGEGGYFRAIAQYNSVMVADPNRLEPGTNLLMPEKSFLRKSYPSLCPPERENLDTGSGRIYEVRRGDTLSGIARAQLGNASRWPEIYRLNREALRNQFDTLEPGIRLALPRDGTTVASEESVWK